MAIQGLSSEMVNAENIGTRDIFKRDENTLAMFGAKVRF